MTKTMQRGAESRSTRETRSCELVMCSDRDQGSDLIFFRCRPYSSLLSAMTGPAEPGKYTDAGTVQRAPSPSDNDDFLSNILTPGSSLNPTFLFVVDGVLALLALTLVSLVIATGGNVHLIGLLFIELALWASIKWWGRIPI